MPLIDRLLRREYLHTTHMQVWDKPDLEAVPNGWDRTVLLEPTQISFELTQDDGFRKAFIWGFIKDGNRDHRSEMVATISDYDALPDWVREDFFEN